VVPLVPQTEASATAAAGEEEAAAEDIAAEEAVCRICMVALSEEAVLKLECCCKGELALAHRGCAIKWFSIKGNGTCDVCSQEVLNLPVTLRRLHHHPSIQAQQQADPTTTATSSRRYRVWHGTPILVIISMLAYFCFLEQLLVACLLHLRSLRLPGHCIILSSVLPDPTDEPPNYIQVGDHGTAALAISLPFACVLGLFSSLTTTKMVSRRYVWIYSAVQFLFIVLFTHLFYRYVRSSLWSPKHQSHLIKQAYLTEPGADASCDRHHPVHLRRLQHGHLHQLCPPPDSQMEGQACGIANHNHNWRRRSWFQGATGSRP